jgi:hypothetical protein
MILGNMEKNKQPIEENVNKLNYLFLFLLYYNILKSGTKLRQDTKSKSQSNDCNC